jgi:hypothetical protein
MIGLANRPASEALGLRFDRPLPGLLSVLSLAALWLLGRRYAGITHDATLYVAQGLRRLDPQIFARDLFFAHGSQDAYSVFSLLYAPLIAALGPAGAAMALTALGQLAFLAAAWALARQLSAGSTRWWSMALLAVISGYYGGVGVFRIAEPFATARSLAEPLAVLALACTLASWHRTAFAALAVCALVHPLVAAPTLAVLLLWHAGHHSGRWRALLTAFAVLALAGAAFDVRLDGLWREALVERSPHLFLSEWHLADWARLAWGLCVVGLACAYLSPQARRLATAIVAVTLAGIAASGVTVDLLDGAHAASVQAWRAHWLLQMLAIMLVPVAVAGLWRSGPAARAAAACVAASCAFGRVELPAAAMLAVTALALAAAERRLPGWMSERAFRTVLVAAIAAAATGLLFEVQSRLPTAYMTLDGTTGDRYLPAMTSVGALLPLAAFLWLLAHSRFSRAAPAAVAVLLAFALLAWDGRKPFSRSIEQASTQGRSWRHPPAGAQVFWPAPSTPAWLLLGTPNWFSADQGAGIVFSRETALQYAARKTASAPLIAVMDNCYLTARSTECRIASHAPRALCRRSDGPDYLVLNGRIEGVAEIGWDLPSAIRPGGRPVHLYACRDLA